MLADFKKFILRGNVVDLAVAVIIGAAFNKVVSSFVKDILMPPIGVAMGGVNFSDLKYVLVEAAGETPAVTLNYGAFIQTIVDFLIIAASIFVMVKVLEKIQKKEEEKPAEPKGPTTEEILIEIRDTLKQK